MHLVRWNPNPGLVRTQTDIDRLFRDLVEQMPRHEAAWVPRMDVAESPTEYAITMDLPGVAKDALKLSIADNVLTVAGEKHVDREIAATNFHRVERKRGAFSRSIQLGQDLDPAKVRAQFADGVLAITIPKVVPAKPAPIAIPVE